MEQQKVIHLHPKNIPAQTPAKCFNACAHYRLQRRCKQFLCFENATKINTHWSFLTVTPLIIFSNMNVQENHVKATQGVYTVQMVVALLAFSCSLWGALYTCCGSKHWWLPNRHVRNNSNISILIMNTCFMNWFIQQLCIWVYVISIIIFMYPPPSGGDILILPVVYVCLSVCPSVTLWCYDHSFNPPSPISSKFGLLIPLVECLDGIA